MRVVDPACGSGAFLIAAYRVLADYFAGLKGAALTPAERSELLIESIFGADVDERAIELARVQLLEEADVRGRLPVLGENLHRGDSLLAPPGESAPKGAVDWSAACRDGRPFDVVLTNPPFRAGYKIRSVAQEDVAKRLAALYPSTYGAHADYSHLFVDLAFRLLGPEGVAGFVLPVGIEGNSSAASVRRLLAERGLRSVVNFRGGQLFDASTYVCTVSTGPSRNAELLRAEFPNSDGRALLEDSVRSRPELMRRQRVSRRTLVREAERGWDPFRLEWELDLRGEVEAELAPLAPEESAQRAVRYGTKPGKQKAFTVAEGEWRKGRAGAIAVGDREIPAKYLPPLVKGGQLSPFHIARSGDRLFVPFETDGSLSGHPSVVAELEASWRPAEAPAARRPGRVAGSEAAGAHVEPGSDHGRRPGRRGDAADGRGRRDRDSPGRRRRWGSVRLRGAAQLLAHPVVADRHGPAAARRVVRPQRVAGPSASRPGAFPG